jgi:plasmid stabilization system protein ParE
MRRVVWSDTARLNYLEILRYIAADDPAAGRQVANTIEETAEGLGKFPTGRPGRVTGTYEKSVPRLPYIVVYSLTVRGGREIVAILRIIHTARDWRPEEWPQ